MTNAGKISVNMKAVGYKITAGTKPRTLATISNWKYWKHYNKYKERTGLSINLAQNMTGIETTNLFSLCVHTTLYNWFIVSLCFTTCDLLGQPSIIKINWFVFFPGHKMLCLKQSLNILLPLFQWGIETRIRAWSGNLLKPFIHHLRV